MTQESVAVPARPIALVVDDEPLILLDTSDIVTDAGYQVVEATTADQALAYLETHAAFDLLVTDIQMPGTMDGIALARHVGERWPHVKILVVSGAVIPLGGASRWRTFHSQTLRPCLRFAYVARVRILTRFAYWRVAASHGSLVQYLCRATEPDGVWERQRAAVLLQHYHGQWLDP